MVHWLRLVHMPSSSRPSPPISSRRVGLRFWGLLSVQFFISKAFVADIFSLEMDVVVAVEVVDAVEVVVTKGCCDLQIFSRAPDKRLHAPEWQVLRYAPLAPLGWRS